MGCDIHAFAEVKRNGKWEMVKDKVFKNPYYREGEPNQIDDDGYEWNPEYTNNPYTGRNYDLFGILADVRNGVGFAGIKTGEGFVPISMPKGLPDDVSNDVLMAEASIAGDDDDDDNERYTDIERMERWIERGSSIWIEEGVSCTNPDAHSETWLTLKELLDYDWNQYTMHRGSIALDDYKILKVKGGTPECWCGDVSGSNIITVDEDIAEKILSGVEYPKLENKSIYVNYHWTEPYSSSAGSFYTETIPALQKLGDPEDVRLVFWFDN